MTGVMRCRPVALVLAAIVAAWAVLVGVELSGQASAFHHHTLLNGTRPLWEAIAIFVPAWVVMVVAMMLPSSLGMLATHGRVASGEARPLASRLSLLAAYILAWTAFGVAALLGDSQVHALVRTSPWLAAHQSLIAATTLVVAGAFQFTKLKRRCLTACRSPLGFILARYRPGARSAFSLGLSHAIFCIGCCWALMLVMFAAGVATLAWMLALSAVMVVEKTTPNGGRLSAPVGLTFIAGGVLTAVLGPVLRTATASCRRSLLDQSRAVVVESQRACGPPGPRAMDTGRLDSPSAPRARAEREVRLRTVRRTRGSSSAVRPTKAGLPGPGTISSRSPRVHPLFLCRSPSRCHRARRTRAAATTRSDIR